MMKLLNTLYVTTPEAYISKEGSNVVISQNGKEIFRIPITNIEAINTFGYQGASPGVMQLCASHGVALSFFTPHGKFVSRIQGPKHGNVLLRVRQYSLDNQEKILIASRFIYGKLFNSRVVLRRFVRDYPNHHAVHAVEQAAEKIRQLTIATSQIGEPDSLRGIEGEGAAIYFSTFPHLILNTAPCFVFLRRNRRPPTDPINAMLSFGYALLANECASALEGVGLDPAVGFMHTLRPGRNSLALDLMEELRAYMVDRFVIIAVR